MVRGKEDKNVLQKQMVYCLGMDLRKESTQICS